jgi:hypothetical protein
MIFTPFIILKKSTRILMLEDHISKVALEQKIVQLFEYRLFPELIELGDISKKEYETVWQHLLALQTSIYYLDAHLEANWNTDAEVLGWHWENINQHLAAFGILGQESKQYLNHIKKYEKHELELRNGKMPMRLDMEYFYFYKSCDVKLLRRLIYERYHLSVLCGSLAEWRYYDLITEVNDDVDDLLEDLDFYNGNRFLLTILTFGKQVAKKEFFNFISLIKSKAEAKVKAAKGKYRDYIFDKTMLRIDETIWLMDQRLQQVDERVIRESKMGQVSLVH